MYRFVITNANVVNALWCLRQQQQFSQNENSWANAKPDRMLEQ